MIHLELVTLTGTKLRETVYEVVLPTTDGTIAVFENHAPLVSTAATGVISVRRKSNHPNDMMDHYVINNGVIEIANNTVRVLVDEAESSNEVSESHAKEALARAKELRANARDQVTLDKAQMLVDRQSSRLKVADLKRRKR